MLWARVAFCLMCFFQPSEVHSEKVESAFVKLTSWNTNTCHLPNELSVTISTEETAQSLTLTSAQLPMEDSPVYALKRDEKEEKEGTVDKEKQNSLQVSGYYTDESGSTSVEVLCTLHRQQPRIEMRGHVVFSNGNIYDLQPDTGTRMDSGHEPEDVSFVLRPREGQHAESDVPGKEQKSAQGVTRGTSRRHKRNTDDIYVDAVVLVGYSEYQRWFGRTAATNTTLKRLEAINSIRQYFALLFNSVKQRFTNASPRYNIKLVGVVIEDARESEWVARVREIQGNDTRLDGQLMLGAIWNWTRNTTDFPQNDVIIAYESLSLYSTQENNFLPDFSYNSSICREDAKHVILISGSDVFALDMLYTTHGLGHALGAEDDGPPNNCSSVDHYIMARDYTKFHQLGTNNPYYFSNCSLQSMNRYIYGLIGTSSWSRSCFLGTLPEVDVPNVTDTMPGEVYDPDEQCRLIYGVRSYYCFNDDGLSHRDICKRMACFGPSHGECFFSYAAEGTTCGNKKWCQHGDCVSSSAAPATDDECIHGDQTSVNCAVVASLPYYCYYSNVELLCCQSCKDIRGSDEGCQFGDNEYAEPSCRYSTCNTTSDSNFVENCCNTCRDFRPTTTVTTTTEVMTTASPTSPETTTTIETTPTSAASTTASTPSATTITTTTQSATTLMTTSAATTKTTTTPVATTITSSTPAATTMNTTTQGATTRTTTPAVTTTMTTPTTTGATVTSTSSATRMTSSAATRTIMTTLTPTTMMTTPSTEATTMITTSITTTKTTTLIATTMMITPSTEATTMMTTPPTEATTMTTPAATTLTTPSATTMTTTTPTATTMTTTPTTAATTMMTTSPPATTTMITTPAATTVTTSTPASPTMTTQTATTRMMTPAATTTTTTPAATITLTTSTTASTTVATTATQKATNMVTTTPAATTMRTTMTQAATVITTSTTPSPDLEYNQSTTTETSSLLSLSTMTKDGQEKTLGTSTPIPEKTTLEKTIYNLPSTSDKLKMAIGLGVGLGVVGLIVVGVAVYRLCLVGRANSAAISTPEWTSLTRI